MAKRRHSGVVWSRRLVQAASTALFLFLFLETVYHPVNRTGEHGKLFFELDPLVLVSTWISGREVVSGLLLSLVVVLVTLLAGRWFCGWLCPFGALHNLVTSLRGGRAKQRIETGRHSSWQGAKYYVLACVLGCAFLGLNLVGWLDPFSVFFRSITVVIFPIFNDGVTAVFGWVYEHDPHLGSLHATALTEPVYEVLRRNVLAPAQPHYYGSLLIAALFAAAVLSNLLRARFWCRFVCPLGALLGMLGKNPLVRIERNAESCNNCGLCVAECQGGAGPEGANGWKPAECFYCWNCQTACPKNALAFRVLAPPEARS